MKCVNICSSCLSTLLIGLFSAQIWSSLEAIKHRIDTLNDTKPVKTDAAIPVTEDELQRAMKLIGTWIGTLTMLSFQGQALGTIHLKAIDSSKLISRGLIGYSIYPTFFTRPGCFKSTSNMITSKLQPRLDSICAKATCSNAMLWHFQGFMVPQNGGVFGAGKLTFSPGYFMQRRQRLVDPIVVSSDMKSKGGQTWLRQMAESEMLLNAITAAVHPGPYCAGRQALLWLDPISPDSAPWPSVFSGMEAHDAILTLPDVQGELRYSPGTVVALTGRVLLHEVAEWNDGESPWTEATFPKEKEALVLKT
ncbi:hypothetical protein BV22DRAFT_1050809 [Leucogyrophana mollusca]|uniref:Uncharacterized protein n=1 Tax=Leucogyrophana mollusca TaxID=85980 RepID=A0ACB8B316_9AGAM|nr:hypothetical protein BV22DRAFT_1050809 [Leucogyrophana mollusca]